MNAYQKSLLSMAAVLLVIGCIGAPYPEQMYLQHIPTVVALVALPVSSRSHPLSNPSFTCLILFLLLHILGARYIYSYVPYDEWLRAVFDADLISTFHFKRNHYDRLVHFAFGLLWTDASSLGGVRPLLQGASPVRVLCGRRIRARGQRAL